MNSHETSAGVVPGAFPGPQESTENDPRSPQDGSKIVLDLFVLPLDFSVRFWIVFGSIWVSFWTPKWHHRGDRILGLGPLGPIQDGLEIALVRFSCRLVVRDRFFGRLGVVLGSFWGRFGALRGSFWCFFGSSTHRFNPSTHQLVDSTHQLINFINSSSHGPSALSYSARRTARCAIK